MSAVSAVANLHQSDGGTVAVDDVSFTVALGQIFGILGRNGARETTTVECSWGCGCRTAAGSACGARPAA